MSEQKLFPIFYKTPNEKPKSPRCTKTSKKFKKLSEDQMLIDAGQKRFGATYCAECDYLYHMGDPDEEVRHLNYHSSLDILRFHGWKNERVVGIVDKARIILITPGDPPIWWKKVKTFISVVNRDLGFYEGELKVDHCKVFLYIDKRKIVGCIVAEPKTKAHKFLINDGVDLCSEESYPIKCGVSRIWVSTNYRKKGIGTALMNSLKRNFTFGHVLSDEEIAFSSPTELGKNFARKYFNTPNFLIYIS